MANEVPAHTRRTPKESGDARLHINLPEADHAALREMAEEECRSISSQIRFLIRNHVAQKKSTIDLPDRDTLEAINF
tara:strand:- start:228 stop:458 length:231 start_codon:yes stop_codon:yes gene_type:complete